MNQNLRIDHPSKKENQKMLDPRQQKQTFIDPAVVNRLPAIVKQKFEERLEDFSQRKSDLIQMVNEGEMTLKAARQRAQELAAEMQQVVERTVKDQKAHVPPLSQKLAESVRNRKKAKSTEELQREILNVMTKNLVELQISNRSPEFEARTYVKNGPNQVAAPSMEKLFEYLKESELRDDQAAAEWSRRQLENMKPFMVSPEMRERIDLVCDRPGALNPSLITKYQMAIVGRLAEPGFLEALISQAIETNDANACSAIFQIARQEMQMLRPEAQTKLMAVLDQFPSQAFSDALRIDSDMNHQTQLEIEQFEAMTLAFIEHSATLEGVNQPTELEVKRRQQIAERSALPMGEGIGLAIVHQ